MNFFNRQAIQSIAIYFVKLKRVSLVHGEINLPAFGLSCLDLSGRDSHIGKILFPGSPAGITAEIIGRNGLCAGIDFFIFIVYNTNININTG